jgi:AhpD family alkylhydroperoxidase
MSHTSGCDYCLAAHTVYAERAGISQEMIRLLLHRDASGDTRLDAVAAFTHELAKKSGRVSDEAISAVRLAGLSDRQITEVLLVMAGITFTNLFNRVNDTVLDFPTPDLA